MRYNIEMGLGVNCDVSLVIYVSHLNVLAHLFMNLNHNVKCFLSKFQYNFLFVK
jgi:hypothetical protein